MRLCSPRYPVDKTDVHKGRSGKAPGRPEAGVRRGRAGLGGGRSNGTVGARLPTPMSDDEEQSAAESDFAPPLSPRLYLTMGLAASMLRAYHRIARMVRKAWTDIRFADDPVEEVEVAAVRCQPERIEDLCRSTKFTRQELKFMYQGFKQVCPTGLVHENTFRDIYAQFFPQGDVSQYAHYLFQAFDQDHNGTITFQDFVVGLSALSRGAPVDKLRWAFQLYDLNKDGIISRDEMLDIIVSIHSLVGNSGSASGGDDDDPDSVRDHANRVFQKLDLNQDGVVTFDEFIETCLKDENVMKSLAILDTVL